MIGRRFKLGGWVLGAAVALATVGCASQMRALNGLYSSDIGAQLVPPQLPPEAREALQGLWRLDFDGSGHFKVLRKDHAVAEGTYAFDHDRVTFVDQKGEMACVQEGPGVYTWTNKQGKVTFTLVSDACNGRSMVLTAQPFSSK